MSSTSWLNVVGVFATIAVSGLAGGIGGALLRETPEQKKISIREFVTQPALARSMALGLIAAFVVPLFLVLAAPGANEGILVKLLHPLDKQPDWWNHLLVLAGFCIVAAIAAQNFLSSISQRVLNAAMEKASEAERKADEAIQVAVVASGDAESAVRRADRADESLSRVQGRDLDSDATLALRAFLSVTGSEPATADLAAAAGLEVDAAARALADLGQRGFVEKVSLAGGGEGWSLTEWGKAWLREKTELSSDDIAILNAIRTSPQRRPHALALSRGLPMSPSALEGRLEQLRKLGLVERSSTTLGGWRLRSAGRQLKPADRPQAR